LLSQLRRQIVEGRFSPGTQFPNRAQLQERYGVSAITVQRVVQRLVTEQFVITRGRKRGTFVTERPPHLARFAVVFNQQPSSNWSRFDQALNAELPGAARQHECAIEPYYGVSPHVDNENFELLMRKVKDQTLAGLIFSDNPTLFVHTPLIEQSLVPRVVLGGQ